MVQNLIELSKIIWHYLMQVFLGVFCLCVLFLIYAKYKTGNSFKKILQLFFRIIGKSVILTGFLLVVFLILTKYVPTHYIVIFLLGASSISILLKYISFMQSAWIMTIDICIVLVNAYCSYVLIMQERFDVYHYFLLAVVVFCFFFYQQTKKIT